MASLDPILSQNPVCYGYDKDTLEYLYTYTASIDPVRSMKTNSKVYLLPGNSTYTPPLSPKENYAVRYIPSTDSWEYVEDHRQKRDKGGVIIEGSGTPYWLPEDHYTAQPRYMADLGPLPEGASTTRPSKPQEVVRIEELREIVRSTQSYLDTTDWYVVRYVDQQVEIKLRDKSLELL